MNPNKFYERTKIFNEIIFEINKVESNYSSELNKLNLRLSQIVENHRQAINSRLNGEVAPKKNINKSKTMKIEENKDNKPKDKKHSMKENEIKENIIIKSEENSMIDKLVSEGLQNLLNFYKNKHKLISAQVSKFGVILYNFASSQKKYDPEDLTKMENIGKDFDVNYLKMTKVKRTYFKKMCELEIYLHMNEKDKKLLELSPIENIEKGTNNNKNNNNKENLTDKEKIEELVKLRKSYKTYLVRLTRTQREYIDKINEIGYEIREFNIDENNLLYDILKTFEENYLALLKEINNFCLLYEHNKKLIKDLNAELENNILYDERVYDNYVFEEFVPKFKNIKDQFDMSVIQKMNELIGFEFDKIKTNDSNNDIQPEDNINYKNIDNNFLFILLMSKFTGGEILLNQKEKEMMIKLLNEENFMKEFLLKLNKIRMNSLIFKHRENFYILIEFFNYIFSKISLTDEQTHELVKVLMILTETYFIKEGDKKIFLISSINLPIEIKESEFWIKYLEYEINIESKKYENRKYSRYEYIVIISNTTHLNEFFVPKEKIEEIVEYFKNKYKFTNDEYEIIKGQLNLE